MTSAALVLLALAAVALGLGGCWIGAFDEARAAMALDLPARHRPLAILPLGKPAGEPQARTSRRPLHSVATYLE